MVGLPPVFAGQINYSTTSTVPPFPSGTTATLVCNTGFSPISNTISTCIGGLWNPPTLSCAVGGSYFIYTFFRNFSQQF